MTSRRDCKFRQELGYDYSCGASESMCNHPGSTFYCVHEGHRHRCPLKLDDAFHVGCESREK